MSEGKAYRSNWRRQWIGALVGAALGWALASAFPVLEQRFRLFTIVLWCGAIGAALANLEGFVRAGAALTRRENRALNLAVGLGVPMLFLLLISVLIN
jgi:hypothetical protein